MMMGLAAALSIANSKLNRKCILTLVNWISITYANLTSGFKKDKIPKPGPKWAKRRKQKLFLMTLAVIRGSGITIPSVMKDKINNFNPGLRKIKWDKTLENFNIHKVELIKGKVKMAGFPRVSKWKAPKWWIHKIGFNLSCFLCLKGEAWE